MSIEGLAACLKAIVGETIAPDAREVVARFALADGATMQEAAEVFGVMPAPACEQEAC